MLIKSFSFWLDVIIRQDHRVILAESHLCVIYVQKLAIFDQIAYVASESMNFAQEITNTWVKHVNSSQRQKIRNFSLKIAENCLKHTKVAENCQKSPISTVFFIRQELISSLLPPFFQKLNSPSPWGGSG